MSFFSRGIQPYKMVETGNTLALTLSTNSPFWAMWRDEKSEPVVVMQQVLIHPTEVECLGVELAGLTTKD